MNTQLILFRLAKQEFALPIDAVREVVITPRVSKVPLAPDFIRGVANIRGNIFAIIDLERKFNLSETGIVLIDEQKTYTLVLNQQNVQMGVLVDSVPDTFTASEEEIDLAPSLIESHTTQKHYIKGIIKKQDKLILLLDLEKLIDSEEISNIM